MVFSTSVLFVVRQVSAYGTYWWVIWLGSSVVSACLGMVTVRLMHYFYVYLLRHSLSQAEPFDVVEFEGGHSLDESMQAHSDRSEEVNMTISSH